MSGYRLSLRMPGKDGELCDPCHPCHGPFDVFPFNRGKRAAFFTFPSSPPVPAFVC